ncbi:sensor histidine kinase [Tessaracoccus oleiagri]|uniref:histidine kinase n=1 Tax=Tessaracoccus oleiagri TaxID=686624 RepID=A0A1G9MXS6_9ACTN|nr:sensor histidine kinase [Tessaracoccus oleiagri]SDL79070.1 Signal transduction histidine kinase [Tessaracoccus oleiagri]
MMSRIRWGDVALALGVLVVLGTLTAGNALAGAAETAAFVILPSVLLVFRRSAPLVSAVGIYLVALLQVIAIGTPLPINLTVLIALYSVTVHGPKGAGLVGLLGGGLGAGLFALLLGTSGLMELVAYFLPTALAVAIAWALGLVVRIRNERAAALADRARAREEQRSREAEFAVAEERARIAREMHDVVAHSLAVIIAQADGGRYAAANDPQQAVKALETVAEIGRSSLADIRRILGVLRSDEADGPLVRPQPTGEDLAEVVERVKETGATVAYTTIGQPRPLLPGMGLTLQRVCQEALTNSLKHAGPGARMSVLLQWTDDAVILQVDDDGRGAASISDGAGTGLVGMRERAAMFGGQLHAAPRSTGGFRVRLALPLHPTGPTRKENP